MSKVRTTIKLDAKLLKDSKPLFEDLGMDLSTAVAIFLKQSLRVLGIPFPIAKEIPNVETIAAMNEYSQMKDHPEKYKRYASFRGVMSGNIAKQE
jgi:DNA-damage-inducible protein J